MKIEKLFSKKVFGGTDRLIQKLLLNLFDQNAKSIIINYNHNKDTILSFKIIECTCIKIFIKHLYGLYMNYPSFLKFKMSLVFFYKRKVIYHFFQQILYLWIICESLFVSTGRRFAHGWSPFADKSCFATKKIGVVTRITNLRKINNWLKTKIIGLRTIFNQP